MLIIMTIVVATANEQYRVNHNHNMYVRHKNGHTDKNNNKMRNREMDCNAWQCKKRKTRVTEKRRETMIGKK